MNSLIIVFQVMIALILGILGLSMMFLGKDVCDGIESILLLLFGFALIIGGCYILVL